MIITKLSAYNISHGRLLLYSLERASRTEISNKRLKMDPWWTPTFTPNWSARGMLILITLLLFLYVAALINHSSPLNYLIAHFTTSLRTQSNAFPRSKRSKYLYCSWRAISTAPIVPLRGLKPNCIPSISTISLIISSILVVSVLCSYLIHLPHLYS